MAWRGVHPFCHVSGCSCAYVGRHFGHRGMNEDGDGGLFALDCRQIYKYMCCLFVCPDSVLCRGVSGIGFLVPCYEDG